MPNVTISVSEELYKAIKKHRQIRWSEVARHAMQEYAKKLALLDKLLEKSELTEKDAIEIGQKIKQGMAKRHGL
jgi:predicted translin family RNA/ssDNA-binding protein